MYRIVKSPRAWWPVTWTGVAEDGSIVENRIELRFRILKVDAFVELVREASAVAEVAQTEAAETDDATKAISIQFAETVMKVAEDWRGVAAENGEPLTWSIDNLALLMNEPRVFDRTMVAFREVTAGQVGIREGN